MYAQAGHRIPGGHDPSRSTTTPHVASGDTGGLVSSMI
jgi:hypothetical protein